MHLEILGFGQPLEHAHELAVLSRREAVAHEGLVLRGDPHRVGKAAAALVGDVQRAGAAVVRPQPPLDEAAVLEIVDQRDHAALRDAERIAQRLLGLALGMGDVAQWDTNRSIPAAARMAGAASLTLWITAIALGRWIGFTLQ